MLLFWKGQAYSCVPWEVYNSVEWEGAYESCLGYAAAFQLVEATSFLVVVFCTKTGQSKNAPEGTWEPSSTHKQYILLSVLPSADKHDLPQVISFINSPGLRSSTITSYQSLRLNPDWGVPIVLNVMITCLWQIRKLERSGSDLGKSHILIFSLKEIVHHFLFSLSNIIFLSSYPRDDLIKQALC